MKNKIKVVIADVDRSVVSGFIPNDLRCLQNIVEGNIEVTTLEELKDQGIHMLVNEDGLLKGLKPNATLFPFFFVGRVIFVRIEGEEFASLTARQVQFILEWLTDLSTEEEDKNA